MEFRDQSNMESVAHDVYVRWQTVRRRGGGAEHYRVCDSRIAKVDCKWSSFQRWGQVRDIQPESLDNRKNKIRPAVSGAHRACAVPPSTIQSSQRRAFRIYRGMMQPH